MARARESVVAAVLAAAGAAGGAYGQAVQAGDGEPVIVGADAPTWKSFEMARFDWSFEILSRYQNDTIRDEGEPEQTDKETLLRPTLNLDMEAFIGHKNLIDLTARAQLGIEQRWIDSDTSGGKEDNLDNAYLYDIEALVFGASRLPFTVYTRRDQQFLDRDFSTSIINTVMETGVRANYQSEVAPTSLHIFYNENDQDDAGGTNDYSYTQFTVAFQNSLLFSPNHRLETVYTFDDISEDLTNSTTQDYTRNDLLLTNIITFGDRNQNESRSYLRYYDQSADFGFTSLRLEEQLRLQHSDTLDSRYNIRAERLERGGVDQNLINGFATVTQQVFDSLTLTGTAGSDYFSTSEDFESYSVYGRGSGIYTKEAGPGRIVSSAGLGYNAQHNGERGGTISVVNDPRVYIDPNPIVIERRNIVQGSIVVRGATGIPTFVEGTDYTVDYFPDRAEIRPIVGGAITNGTALLINYTIGPEPESDIGTLETDLAFRYTFTEGALNGVSLYTSYRRIDHTLDTADPSQFALDDSETLIYGVEYQRGWLELLAEQEHRRSTQNPYDITRFQALGEYPLAPGSRVGVQVDYEIQDFDNPANHVDFLRVSARWNQRWNRELDTLLRLDYRNEMDDLRGNADAIDAVFSFRWITRQTNIYATFRATLTTSDNSETESQFMEVGLTRRF